MSPWGEQEGSGLRLFAQGEAPWPATAPGQIQPRPSSSLPWDRSHLGTGSAPGLRSPWSEGARGPSVELDTRSLPPPTAPPRGGRHHAQGPQPAPPSPHSLRVTVGTQGRPGGSVTHKPCSQPGARGPGGPGGARGSCWSRGSRQAVVPRSASGAGVPLASLHRREKARHHPQPSGRRPLRPKHASISSQSSLRFCKAKVALLHAHVHVYTRTCPPWASSRPTAPPDLQPAEQGHRHPVLTSGSFPGDIPPGDAPSDVLGSSWIGPPGPPRGRGPRGDLRATVRGRRRRPAPIPTGPT